MSYIFKNSRIVTNGQILKWTLKFDGRDDLEFPIQIQVVTKKVGRFWAVGLGDETKLPDSCEIDNHMLPLVMHHGKQFWIQHDTLFLLYEETYKLFEVEEVMDGGAVLYFHSYLPEGFGSGVIVYDPNQNQESNKA